MTTKRKPSIWFLIQTLVVFEYIKTKLHVERLICDLSFLMEVKLCELFPGSGIIIRTWYLIAEHDLKRKCSR